jgi:hypothetical protein
MYSNVLFPAPDGPIRATDSPLATSKSKPRSTSMLESALSLNDLLIFFEVNNIKKDFPFLK